MPEYPDIVVYIEALEKRIVGQTLERVRLGSPFLLRTAGAANFRGRRQEGCSTASDGQTDLHWPGGRSVAGFALDDCRSTSLEGPSSQRRPRASKKALAKNHLAAFEFNNGTLSLTEAGTQRRASLHVFASEADLQQSRSRWPGNFRVISERSNAVQLDKPQKL